MLLYCLELSSHVCVLLSLQVTAPQSLSQRDRPSQTTQSEVDSPQCPPLVSLFFFFFKD